MVVLKILNYMSTYLNCWLSKSLLKNTKFVSCIDVVVMRPASCYMPVLLV